MKSALEELFQKQLDQLGLPPAKREYRFCPPRRWRFDFAWPLFKMAVEIQGGTWIHGRHNRGAGFEKECERRRWCARLGWRVFEFTGKEVKNETAINWMIAQFQAEQLDSMIFE